MTALDIVFGSLAAMFAGKTIATLSQLRWANRLPSLEKLREQQTRANAANSLNQKVSIVLAARDEAERVEQTIRRLLAQTGVSFEIIVVDDRSTDGTGAVLEKLAREDSRIRSVRVDVLPEGWLGKCHACHVGAQQASSEWILFTDADCWTKPDVVHRALCVAEIEQAQHVALTPGVAPETSPAMAWHLSFLLSIVGWIAAVNRNRPRAYIGIGAFNLVSAKTYRAFGGYETLRLAVLDDVKLGLLVRRAGDRTRAFIGGDDVECHWGTSVRQMIKIMEKNYFAAVEYYTVAGIVAGLGGLLVWISVPIAAISGKTSAMLAMVAFLTLIIPTVILAQRLRWPIIGALMMPLVFPALAYAVLNSTLVTLRNRGIRWRGTFYSLEALREAAKALRSP